MGEVCLGRGELGGQDVDLLGDVGERGDIARNGGAGDSDARGGVLRLLHRTPAIGRQRCVSPIVLLGESRLGLIDGDGRACAVDQRVLGVQRRPPAAIRAAAAATPASACANATLKSRSSMRASTWPALTG